MRTIQYGILAWLLAIALLLCGCGGAAPSEAGDPAAVPVDVPGAGIPAETDPTEPAPETAEPPRAETDAADPGAEATGDPSPLVPGPAVVPVEVPPFEEGTQTGESSPAVRSSETEPAAPETEIPAQATEAAPGESLPPARAFTDEDFHFYDGRTGDRIEGKINVAFFPEQYGADGKPDPDIRVWDSCEITHPEEIRAICGRILASSFYDQSVYGRTLDSMVTEWEAHNDVHSLYPNERTRHVDFNRADEGLSYADFWQRALRDYLESHRP